MNPYKIAKALYKNDNNGPLELSKSQQEIFRLIATRTVPEDKFGIHCMTFTRFGKSMTAGIGVLTRVVTHPEKWAIIAPSKDKAKVIMGYIIEHIFDNPIAREAFEIDSKKKAQKIRRTRAKDKLTFRCPGGGIGEVFILSAHESRNKDPLDALMGYGASGGVILDESSLIGDDKHAGILRMLGDQETPFIFEIGNPFRRNHFYLDSMQSNKPERQEKYYHITVDYKKGLNENRITEKQVDMMRGKPFFDVMYECKFPEAERMDQHGWMPLLTYTEINQARERDVQSDGVERLGVDIAQGGDRNAFIGRTLNHARIIKTDRESDLMTTAENIVDVMKNKNILPRNCHVDAVGNGAGVYSRLKQKNMRVWGVENGASADKKDEYRDKKAENYWRLRKWIKEGGSLSKDQEWDELAKVKYRFISKNKIQIIPKKKLTKSPDVADALALTFNRNKPHNQERKNIKPANSGWGGY